MRHYPIHPGRFFPWLILLLVVNTFSQTPSRNVKALVGDLLQKVDIVIRHRQAVEIGIRHGAHG
jgi:hypothetical protein